MSYLDYLQQLTHSHPHIQTQLSTTAYSFPSKYSNSIIYIILLILILVFKLNSVNSTVYTNSVLGEHVGELLKTRS